MVVVLTGSGWVLGLLVVREEYVKARVITDMLKGNEVENCCGKQKLDCDNVNELR
jgi:hypothetical protein